MTLQRVKTTTGVLDGFMSEKNVETYLGIPYAKPPIGELRWKAPQPLEPSDELISCRRLGYSAMQDKDKYEPSSLNPQSEDCLYLNVWVKDKSKKNQPVMVYVHGGAYFSGGSADPLYFGENFAAKQDVVLVSINYRINVFGSMLLSALPGGEDYQEAGYLEMLDQILALKWIKKNIAQFGGDPDSITLFGESAGSSSAALLAICPAAKGLFNRAICESGPIQLYKTPEMAKPFALEFAEIMGCKSVDELQQKSSDELIAGMDIMCERDRNVVSLTYSPVCDGTLLPKDPMKAWADGAAKDIDIMTGCCENEMNYFKFYFEDLKPFWHGQFPFHFDSKTPVEKWEKVFAQVHGQDELDNDYVEFMNQTGFRVGTDLMALEQSQYRPTYTYLFTYKSTKEGMGSCHAIEVPFVMRNLDTSDGLEFTGPNPPEHLSDEMNNVWYSFAKYGKPRPELYGMPEWPAFDDANRNYMVMNDKKWEVRQNINDDNIKAFTPMYEESIL
ncbi:carboxylesterase family protein [Bifidobacterium sp. ESL0790]|uniref:carboxylesterase/lipase family protein n=1 Tax=Bifidobacterium sp. ESL0790 TaxID=2983233 RepID=UPI0023F9CD01|nr:carboxylesterase family protein [Bifidobacterium sp. ESL0790]WEV72731.1 carboxylesterase family protein [Bifidobacterium sp. ESL0790]